MSQERLAGDCASEYHALLTMWGRLQTELSTQYRAHVEQVKALDAQVLRLRAELVIMRTALYWGLGTGALTSTTRASRRPLLSAAGPDETTSATAAAEAVLCRTACEGHAHHWLDEDHGCHRTGQPCHRLAHPGSA